MNSAIDIVRAYLTTNGFEGLFNPDGECACKTDDLSPGTCLAESCAPGYLKPCDCGGHDWHIAREKEGRK